MKTKKMPGKRPARKMPKKGKTMITALAVMSAFALSGCGGGGGGGDLSEILYEKKGNLAEGALWHYYALQDPKRTPIEIRDSEGRRRALFFCAIRKGAAEGREAATGWAPPFVRAGVGLAIRYLRDQELFASIASFDIPPEIERQRDEECAQLREEIKQELRAGAE